MVLSSYIVAYLFVAGAGSGAFFVAYSVCLWDMLRQSRFSERAMASVQSAFYSAPALCALAVLLLVLDLGNPNRILPLLLNPFGSVIGMGAWFLGMFELLVLSLAAISFQSRKVSRALLFALGLPAFALSVGNMSYTGILLSDLVSIDFWHTPWLTVLFVVSSLTTGAAVVVLGATFKGTSSTARDLEGIWRALFVLTLLEALAIVVFLGVGMTGSPSARLSVECLIGGDLAPMFWTAVVAIGFVLPWAVHLGRRLTGTPVALVISSIGVLIGGFALRCCIVGAGLFSPLVLSASVLGT